MFTKIKTFFSFFMISLGLLLVSRNVFGQNIMLSSEYAKSIVPDFPEVLNVGVKLECKDYQIQIMGQPVVSKSNNALIADLDMSYLIVRVGITNTGDRPIQWITPASFTVQETYLSHAYGIYPLDAIMSAKAASGFNLPAFFTMILPEKTLSTVLAFEVFPDAENWIITFSPSTFSNEIVSDCVNFMLPKALKQ